MVVKEKTKKKSQQQCFWKILSIRYGTKIKVGEVFGEKKEIRNSIYSKN